ncbi:MAG: hypothetical protein ACOCUR_01790, partial [Nanoarchaeota archaeon]
MGRGKEPEDTSDEDMIDVKDISAESKKEKEEFEKELKHYPVLGDDNSAIASENNTISSLFRKFFLFFEHKFKMFTSLFYHVGNRDRHKQLSKELDKKKINDNNDFILEGFEGVYYSDSKRITKKKLILFSGVALAVILLGFLMVLAVQYVVELADSQTSGPCPYECCVDTEYEDKLCPGLAKCEGTACVLPQCPEHYECCSGNLYKEKSCDEDYLTCSINFECVKKECPYECCTESDGYLPKDCVNDGNCINNKCHLEPCPHECCIDEIEYDDKECGPS